MQQVVCPACRTWDAAKAQSLRCHWCHGTRRVEEYSSAEIVPVLAAKGFDVYYDVQPGGRTWRPLADLPAQYPALRWLWTAGEQRATLQTMLYRVGDPLSTIIIGKGPQV